MEIICIVAMADNRVIGHQGGIPWQLPEDLKMFKRTTMGHALLMGRKTYESIGKPLPGRKNIIISRNLNYIAPGCYIADSIESAISLCGEASKVFVLGGEQIFKSCLPICDTVILTILDLAVEGDTYFPELPPAEFKEVHCEEFSGSIPHKIVTYTRV